MGYRIKEVREEKRMTQEELSAKSGISRTTISGLENGTVRSTSTKTLRCCTGNDRGQYFFCR